MRVLFFIVFVLISGVSFAGEFDGKYRLNKSWNCADVGSDGGAIMIDKGMFHGVESSCKMKKPTKVRDLDATLYDIECSGEGTTWTNRMMIMRKNGGVFILQKDSVGEWQRCPR